METASFFQSVFYQSYGTDRRGKRGGSPLQDWALKKPGPAGLPSLLSGAPGGARFGTGNIHRGIPFCAQKNEIHTAKWKKTREYTGMIDEER